MNSFTEENYIKAIYSLSKGSDESVSTNAIAESLTTKASSVTDMIKKLALKELVIYKKYQGVNLTREGKDLAISIVRKHRLWEFFLVEKLKFKWDEVHDIAEQLEHIKSPALVEKLDSFLSFPKYDPHGDPIPDAEGNIVDNKEVVLNEMQKGEKGIVVGVKDSSSEFLKYLDKLNLGIGTSVEVLECFDFDASKEVKIDKKENSLSEMVTQNIYIKRC
jgi:DtxR family Mn-dependent transcriptional regulator